jgi:hypothetical protein
MVRFLLCIRLLYIGRFYLYLCTNMAYKGCFTTAAGIFACAILPAQWSYEGLQSGYINTRLHFVHFPRSIVIFRLHMCYIMTCHAPAIRYAQSTAAWLPFRGASWFVGVNSSTIPLPVWDTRRNSSTSQSCNGGEGALRPVACLGVSNFALLWYVASAQCSRQLTCSQPTPRSAKPSMPKNRRGACRALLANDQHYRASEAASNGFWACAYGHLLLYTIPEDFSYRIAKESKLLAHSDNAASQEKEHYEVIRTIVRAFVWVVKPWL